MNPRMNRGTGIVGLLLGYALFVVYGSLVPLHYQPIPLDLAWQRFQQIPFLKLGLESRADWVANGVLYVPLGLLASRLGHARGLPWLAAAALASVVCSVLGVVVEFTQLYFPGRTVSQNDILAECVGSIIGAFAAPAMGAWLDRLAQAWRSGGARLLPRLLEAYALAYVLLSFFPYDLLLSAAELRGKWQSQQHAWLIAPQDRGAAFTLLQLLVEVALVMPLGALRFLHRSGSDGRRVPRVALAACTGLLLGVTIEIGQFFVATAVSQGASVLTRALGVAAGCWLLPRVVGAGWAGLRRALRPWALPLALLYLPLLTAVNGYFSHAWQGPAQAVVSWQRTQLLPFYYHYFTTEALALYSLISVALAYLPVAALCWLRGTSMRVAVLAAGGLALLVEAGKLFLADIHADPTNVIVAMAATAAAMATLALAQRQSQSEASLLAAAAASDEATAGRALPAVLALPLAAAWALNFPVQHFGLLLMLGAAAALVWRWPVLALALVPAALPALDLAPWSGRFFWDEFDLLQAVVLSVALWRGASAHREAHARAVRLAFVVLACSLALSTLRALWPVAALDGNSFSSYYSPYNALRIVKGAAWAWVYLRLWQAMPQHGVRRSQMLTLGMALGLAWTVAFAVAERSVFTGLLDFASDYRVTGPFSAMHKGGAYIECYLAVASAFVMAVVLRPGPWPPRVAALLLMAGAGYTMLVTYSRNGYAALLAVVLMSVLVQVLAQAGAGRASMVGRPRWAVQGAWAAVLLVLVGAAAVPLAGGYARQRLAQSGQDLQVRVAHWQDGLAMRNGGALTDFVGMGIGRFPERHYWASREALHAGSYRLEREGELTFLRLARGATLYIEQIVPRPELAALRLSFDWRAARGQGLPVVALCEKWTLTSLACAEPAQQEGGTPAPPSPAPSTSASAPGAQPWVHQEFRIDASRLLARPGVLHAPLKLALVSPAEGSYDITHVRLSTALGDELLRNGDFSQGLDRWFFATDVDPPWHLHSLPVAVLFDQGWLGVAAWLGLALLVLAHGARLLWRGTAQVDAALPALAGFVVSGSLNTLIDAPRFLWLLLVLMALAALGASVRSLPVVRPGGPTRPGGMGSP